MDNLCKGGEGCTQTRNGKLMIYMQLDYSMSTSPDLILNKDTRPHDNKNILLGFIAIANYISYK